MAVSNYVLWAAFGDTNQDGCVKGQAVCCGWGHKPRWLSRASGYGLTCEQELKWYIAAYSPKRARMALPRFWPWGVRTDTSQDVCEATDCELCLGLGTKIADTSGWLWAGI